jgi:hypothetical protein
MSTFVLSPSSILLLKSIPVFWADKDLNNASPDWSDVHPAIPKNKTYVADKRLLLTFSFFQT